MRASNFAYPGVAALPASVEMSSRRNLAFWLPGRERFLRDERHAER
jgi:hypothetical protein